MLERTLRTVIGDDHPIFRAGLRSLLATDDRVRVVAEAADGREAVDLVERCRPDLLLLDRMMPRMDGIGVLRELRVRGITTRTILLTAEIEPAQVVEALKYGALGVLMKSAATEFLFRCIDAVMSGQYWVDRGTTADLVTALRRYELMDTARVRALPVLTQREKQLLEALLSGESNKGIANKLGIAEQTVKNHLSNLYEKFGVSSRLELVAFARTHRLA